MKSLTEKELETWFKQTEKTLQKRVKFSGLSKEEMAMQLLKIRLIFETQKTLLSIDRNVVKLLKIAKKGTHR